MGNVKGCSCAKAKAPAADQQLVRRRGKHNKNQPAKLTFEVHFAAKLKRKQVALDDRANLEAHMHQLIDAAKKELGSRSAIAEK